jgi:prolyl-tRNA synthetase
MRTTRLPYITFHEEPAEAEVISHRLMLRGGYIKKVAGGLYDFLPLGARVLRRIEKIVREEMDRAGAFEILMPALQPVELWRATDRWDKYGKELFRLSDRHDRSFALGPTHEEVVTDLARGTLRSYRQLPVTLYQIQTKFRDEMRPRFGLMRGREFVMKDAYSFARSEKEGAGCYATMQDAYFRIFSRLGLSVRMVEADTGMIGGSSSHEFMVLAPSGEDTVVFCPSCTYSSNVELAGEAVRCPLCHAPLDRATAIEVGHVFDLGTRYSEPMNAGFLDPDGRDTFYHMGCYGIGVSRLLAAAIEQSHDDSGIVWPYPMAPYAVAILPLGGKDPILVDKAEQLTRHLEESFPDLVLVDDREARPGVKFADADLCGFPVQVILGEKNLKDNRVEVKIRKSGERQLVGFSEMAEWVGDHLRKAGLSVYPGGSEWGGPDALVDTLTLDR